MLSFKGISYRRKHKFSMEGSKILPRHSSQDHIGRKLAMHSCYETAGAKDTVSLIRLMKEFYSSHFEETGFGTLAVHKA